MLRKDRFDEREVDFYEALYTQSQAQVWMVDTCLLCTSACVLWTSPYSIFVVHECMCVVHKCVCVCLSFHKNMCRSYVVTH